MAKYKFVGFQEHVEVPEGFNRLEVSAEIDCGKLDPFALLSQPAELSKWFYEIESLDAKPSGVIKFANDAYSGICISADLGKEITLVSDLFGELSANVKGSNLKIVFRILTDAEAEKRAEFESMINTLKELVK